MSIFDGLLGGVVSGGLSFLGGQQRNDSAREIADNANTFSAQQFASRYQTTTADMQAAGLNPMLAYSQGGGSPPTGQQASVQDVVTPAVQSYQAQRMNSAQVANVEADTENKRESSALIRAQTGHHNASAGQASAQTGLINDTAAKIKQEIENMPKGSTMGRSVSEWNTEAIRFAIEKIKDESALLRNRATSEDVYQNQMRALIGKLQNDTALGKLDLKAAQDMLNAGRLGKELEPFARMFFNIMRTMR